MSKWLLRRWDVIREVSHQPLVRALFWVWALSGAWDLLLSEWVPEEYAKRLPRFYQLAAMSIGLLSWQLWIVVGFAILTLASIEYAIRRKAPHEPERKPIAQLKEGTDFRQLQALADRTSAIREHTEELRRQRKLEQQPPNPTPVAPVALPAGAKFRFREETYWHVARQYSADEAKEMRALIKEIYSCLMGKGAVLVNSYDGPLTTFTRNWRNIVPSDGPSAAWDQLNNFRNEVILIYQTIQNILVRNPYHRQDLSDIIREESVVADMNAAFNDYMAALRALPNNPSTELVKIVLGPLEINLENATEKYRSWIGLFDQRAGNVRSELEKLSTSDVG
jgi:hypothetical protein